MRWDCLPAADLVTQRWGCTDLQAEWPAPWCPKGRYHSGIDLGAVAGGWSIYRQPVLATRGGIVTRVGFPNGLGWQAVFLQTVDRKTLIYGHLDEALVHVGQLCGVTQPVGLLGTRGNSTAPHLHLEARIDGAVQNVDNQAAGVIDPTPYLTLAGSVPMPPGWHDWESIGGQLVAIDCASRRPGTLNVVGRAQDGTVWHKAWDHDHWTAWEQLGGRLIAGPQITVEDQDTLHLVGVGLDRAGWHAFWHQP